MSTLLNKITLSHLFEISPTPAFHYYLVLLFFFIVILIGAVILSKKIKKEKILKLLLKKLIRNLKIFSLIGLVLLGSRYEKIPYLSMRIWLILVILLILFSAGKIIYIYKKHYPKKIEEFQKIIEKNKYLPEFKNKKHR